MLAKLAALGAAIALPFVCINCLSSHAPMIQSALQAQTAGALESASIKGVAVKADGRDIVLEGVVPSQDIKLQAGVLAAALPGVRSVNNLLTLGAVPAPPAVSNVQTQLNEILLRKKIEFETNRDVILASSSPTLREALDVLKQAPNMSITIHGHTDSRGNAEANKSLSARRAKAVADWFAKHGVEAARLSSAGFGAEKPIDSNDTDAGRAKNRRVEIVANAPAAVGGK
jgi:outer membrane protein OmpA-like peptidoglycan-associated protein